MSAIKPLRLRIESDGTSIGTKIINLDNDEILSNVLSATWHMDGHGEAELTIVIPKAEIEATGNFFTHVKFQGPLTPGDDKRDL